MGESQSGRSGRARLKEGLKPRAVARRVAGMAVAVVALYFVWPAFTDVFAAWPGLRALDPIWFLIVLLFQIFSFVCLWTLMRIAHRREEWFLAATSQLTQLAVSRLVPGGAAPGSAVQYRMFLTAGVSPVQSVYAITAVTLASNGTLLILPVLSLPAILTGVEADRRLLEVGVVGALLFLAVAVVIAVLMARDDPLRWIGRAGQWVRNQVRRSKPPLSDLDERLVAERSLILDVLGRRWKSAVLAAFGRPFFEFLALLASLAAVGADVSPSLVLLAYVVSGLLSLVPLTPGGVGFVEAGLVTTLGLAGVGAGDATAATLVYRLASFWLPIPAGLVAYVVFRRRFGAPRGGAGASGGPEMAE